MKTSFLSFTVCLGALCHMYAGSVNPVVTAPEQPKIEWTVSGREEYTFSADFENGLGSQDALNTEWEAGVAVPLMGSVYATGGVFYQRFDFGGGDAPVPATLQSAGMHVGMEYRYQGKTAAMLRLSPGFYGEDLDGDGFNVPVLLAGSYYLTPSLIIGAGVSYDAFNKYQVLPLVGFRWMVSETWSVNALFPELSIAWTPSESITFDVGAKFAGGNFKTSSGDSRYAGAKLEYSDIRVGAGIKYRGWKPFDLYVHTGWSFRRQFRYDEFDRDYDTDGAPYVGLELRGNF